METEQVITFSSVAGGLLTALGGWEFIKYMLNRRANSRVAEANAFKIEREALVEDYKRVQEEVDELKMQVAKLYKEIDALKEGRLKLIQEKNELELALKEAEKHVCLQPDDKCLQRLNPNDHCRLRKILRGEYVKDHPDAIITASDMKPNPAKAEESGNEENKGMEGE